jgi:methionyl aminopeptidase
VFPVKPVRSLCAHDIQHYRIHGEKQIPFVKNSDQTKMEEGEIFAIETFGTTGRGYLTDDVSWELRYNDSLLTIFQPSTYGYKLKYEAPEQVSLPLASARRLHKTIKENFGSIVFCRRYLERLGVDRYLAGVSLSLLAIMEKSDQTQLNSLVSNGVLEHYSPLMDVKGSYSAQFEHVSG